MSEYLPPLTPPAPLGWPLYPVNQQPEPTMFCKHTETVAGKTFVCCHRGAHSNHYMVEESRR